MHLTSEYLRLEEALKCPICHNTLEDPRFLPCHHSFCYRCLAASRRSNGGELKCPTCGQRTEEVVDNLPCDSRASSLKETLENLTRSSRAEEPVPEAIQQQNLTYIGYILIPLLQMGIRGLPQTCLHLTCQVAGLALTPLIQQDATHVLCVPYTIAKSAALTVIFLILDAISYFLFGVFTIGEYLLVPCLILVKNIVLYIAWGIFGVLKFIVVYFPIHVFLLAVIVLPFLAINKRVTARVRRLQERQDHGLVMVLFPPFGIFFGIYLFSSYHDTLEPSLFNSGIYLFIHSLFACCNEVNKGKFANPIKDKKELIACVILTILMNLVIICRNPFINFVFSWTIIFYGAVFAVAFILCCLLLVKDPECFEMLYSDIIGTLNGSTYSGVLAPILQQILSPGIGVVNCTLGGALIALGFASGLQMIFPKGDLNCSKNICVSLAAGLFGSTVGFMIAMEIYYPVICVMLGFYIFLILPNILELRKAELYQYQMDISFIQSMMNEIKRINEKYDPD